MKKTIIDFLHKRGFSIKRILPRPSTLFVKKFMLGRELTVVEVGTFEGENAINLLKMLPIKKIYLIDPYKKYDGYDEKKTSNFLDIAKEKVEKIVSKSREKAVLIEKMSSDALEDIPNDLDFIYIDGNHEYKYAKEDMKNYYKKLRVGGVMAGHDIENGVKLNEGVTKAFVEFVNEKKLQPYILFPDWWVIKK